MEANRPAKPPSPDADGGIARRLASLLGLGVRGRLVTIGVDQVKIAAAKDKVVVALVAHDASENSREKVLGILRARGIEVIETLDAGTLGAAVGRDRTTAVGILDAHLASGVRSLVKAGSVESERRMV